MTRIKINLNSNKFLEYLLYLFIFLLPWQTRWIIYDPQINGVAWEYGRISLYAFDVVFILLMAIWLYGYIVGKLKGIKILKKLEIGNWKLEIGNFIYYFIALLLYCFFLFYRQSINLILLAIANIAGSSVGLDNK